MIRALLVLLLCQLIGEVIKTSTESVVPGPVFGMTLLLGILFIKGSVSQPLETISLKLISLLPMLFLPATVGIAFLGSEFNNQWAAFAGAVVIGTFLTLLFTALLFNSLAKFRQ